MHNNDQKKGLSVPDLKERAKRIVELTAENYADRYKKSDSQYLLQKTQIARRILKALRPDKADIIALSFEAEEKGISVKELARRIKAHEEEYSINLGIVYTALKRMKKRIDNLNEINEVDINNFKYEMQHYIEKNLYFIEKEIIKKKSIFSIIKEKTLNKLFI